MTVSVADAADKLIELLAAVESGERVSIERDGKAIAEIIQPQPDTDQPQPRRKPKFGGLKGTFVEIDPNWHRAQEDVEAWLRGDV